MLPLMYLIDSICKNHGSPYKELFQQGLVDNSVSFTFSETCWKMKAKLEERKRLEAEAAIPGNA